jgi:hypothetical protein
MNRPTPTRDQQQGDVQRTKVAAAEGHGQCISAQCQAQQQATQRIETAAHGVRLALIGWQVAISKQQRHQAQRQHHQKHRPPAESADQQAAE